MKIIICYSLLVLTATIVFYPTPQPSLKADIKPEIIEYPCLTWDEHVKKYPHIQKYDLVSAMFERCAR
jgi:hypothetical protein